MKNIFFIVIFFVFSLKGLAQSDEVKILSTIAVEKDYYVEEAKGLNIACKYNFLSLEEQHHDDTILIGATFYVTTRILENGVEISPAKGYASLIGESGTLMFSIPLTGDKIEASKFSKSLEQFIPYASLAIPEGKHTLQVSVSISGKDATGKVWEDKRLTDEITIIKPPIKLVNFNIDYIEVNPLNAKGNAWDYSVFKTDAPDVDVSIMIGSVVVWKSHVNDTYLFSVGPYSRNISFTISQGDKVGVLIQDMDVMYHDFVAKWLFATNNKSDGVEYTYDKSKGNIKSCNLKFSIHPLNN